MSAPRCEPSAHGPILILGAGAVGGYIGALLHGAGYPVTLADGWRAQVDAITQRGVVLELPEGTDTFHPPIIHLSGLDRLPVRPTVILLCAKLYETSAMLGALDQAGLSGISLVNLQNGLMDEAIAAEAGRSHVLGGIATGLNVAVIEPGCIRRDSASGLGEVFQVGELNGERSERACRIAELLAVVDHAVVVDDLLARRWQKLSLNCLSSGLCAISGLTVAALYRDTRARVLLARLGSEALSVSSGLGYASGMLLGVEAGVWHDAALDKASACEQLHVAFETQALMQRVDYRSGMLQDILRGRPTEVEFFNGYVARRGEACGRPAETHAVVAERVRRIERGAASIGAGNLTDLVHRSSGES